MTHRSRAISPQGFTRSRTDMPVMVLVKHSMPKIDPLIPARDWQLSNEGKHRCVWLTRELAKFQPSLLCSSVERKAKETADLVGNSLGLAPECIDGLQENDRTNFPYIDDATEFEQRFQAFFDNPMRRLIGHESASEALTRFGDAVSRIVAKRPGQGICIIAHGTVISLFVAQHNAVSGFDIWRSLSPLPAYIAVSLPGYECTEPVKGFAG